MAFLFVDRIITLDPGRSARGVLTVPSGGAFPLALVAEAVGQLAAWSAMAANDFTRRPVAALAGEVRFGRELRAGDVVELAIEIEAGDDPHAVAYGGWAEVGGERIIELRECVGALLPLEEFDAPEDVRRALMTLQRIGVRVASAAEPLRYTRAGTGARLEVPLVAPFFADHFPRRPVLPGTLLLDALARLAGEVAGDSIRLERVCDVKLRSFLAPGAVVELAAEVVEPRRDGVEVRVAARAEGRRVASARVVLG